MLHGYLTLAVYYHTWYGEKQNLHFYLKTLDPEDPNLTDWKQHIFSKYLILIKLHINAHNGPPEPLGKALHFK